MCHWLLMMELSSCLKLTFLKKMLNCLIEIGLGLDKIT
jgi:hypothetical protein